MCFCLWGAPFYHTLTIIFAVSSAARETEMLLKASFETTLFSFWKGGTLFFPFEVELGQSTEYLNFGPNLIINQVEGGRGATFMKNGIYEQISWDNKAPSKYRHNIGCKNFKLGLSTDLGVYFTYHSHCCPPLEYSHLLPWLLTWQPFSQVDPVRFRLCS